MTLPRALGGIACRGVERLVGELRCTAKMTRRSAQGGIACCGVERLIGEFRCPAHTRPHGHGGIACRGIERLVGELRCPARDAGDTSRRVCRGGWALRSEESRGGQEWDSAGRY